MRTRTRFALAALGFAAGQSFLLGVPSCAQDKAADAPSKNSNAVAGSQSSLRDVAAELTKKLHDDADVKKLKEQRLVIAEFENINGKGDAVPRILQEMLTTAFIKAKHFRVVERKQLDKALEELHFTLSDLTDPDKRKKIGKLVNASYLLIGSIADTGDSTAINTRIVAIESGENIAAEDANIKRSDPSTPADANPRPMPANGTAKIDLQEKSASNSAGQYTGKQADFGLLGVAKYKIAWEENLGSGPFQAFSAGDVQGTGICRLVLARSGNLVVMKWEDGKFRQTWETEIARNQLLTIKIIPIAGNPSVIFVSNVTFDFARNSITDYIANRPFDPATNLFRWDGTVYSKVATRGLLITDGTTQGNQLQLVGVFHGGIGVQHRNTDNLEAVDIQNQEVITNGIGILGSVLQADFDGDQKTEFAAIESGDDSQGHISVFTKDGTRKAITTETYYSFSLARWQPRGVRLPYIVATRNTQDETKKLNGGYVCFVQWDGESYREVFKSNKLHSAIIDVQVCDPKGEGTTGLVVLSADSKGYYLTKIVPEK